jgi:hypothetical protein
MTYDAGNEETYSIGRATGDDQVVGIVITAGVGA